MCISWPNSIALLLHLFLQIHAPLLQRVCHSPRVNFERPFVKMLATSRSIVCAELQHFRGGEPEPGSAMVPPKWMGLGLTISLEALMGIPGECEAALWKSFHHYSKLHWPGEAAQLKWLAKSAVMSFSDRQEAGNATLGWHFCLPPAAPQPGPGSGSWGRRELKRDKRQKEPKKEKRREHRCRGI